MSLTTLDFNSVDKYLGSNGCTWVFNPHDLRLGAHDGIARCILDCMMLEHGKSCLTHEVLTTLMAEEAAVMNTRLLVPMSADPESSLILTPIMLLTLKMGSLLSPPSDGFGKVDLLRGEWK